MNSLRALLPDYFSLKLFLFFLAVSVASVLAGFAAQEPFYFAVPALVLAVYFAVVDFKKLYIALFAFIPLSVEFHISGSLATDLPTEPLIVALMFIFILYILLHPEELRPGFLKNWMIVLILVHFFWMAFLLLHTENFTVSLKFVLAKVWYILTFVFLTGVLIRSRMDFKPIFWAVFIPLVAVTVLTIIRHYQLNFEFDRVNDTLTPYFRNHVSYAALLSLFMPFAIAARRWYPAGSRARNFINFGILVFLVGIFFAYTRGAWLALIVAAVCFVLIRWNVLRLFVLTGAVLILIALGYMMQGNKYLDFAPEYESTIYHPELGDHLQATFGLEDVSSAERVYRWVAAFHMASDRPITGFGPGNFYPYYKNYTLKAFRTYISRNEERSTVHNYFLLMLVEQGLVGFLLFTALIILVLVKGENIYHKTKSKLDRGWVMAVNLSFIVILVQLMLSDLVETDKVGSFFFVCIALLANQQINNQRNASLEAATENTDVVNE